VIWSHPGNDVTGMLARSEKVAGICEKVCLFVDFVRLTGDSFIMAYTVMFISKIQKTALFT